VAYSFVGISNFLTWSITNPDILEKLFKIGTDICIEYANALFEHGVDAVCLPDSIVCPDLFPPQLFESMVLTEYRKLNQMTKGLMILHMCGDATDILEPISIAGFDGISIEEKVDVKYAKNVIKDRSCLIGNVSPVEMLFAKSPEQITGKAKQCIEDGVDILAPGCGIAPRTPLRNMKAFVFARDEYYAEKGLL
jgi:[methyl-Co(III) methanol-specific corrinoid protein]:coenzyme M methyltransferase